MQKSAAQARSVMHDDIVIIRSCCAKVLADAAEQEGHASSDGDKVRAVLAQSRDQHVCAFKVAGSRGSLANAIRGAGDRKRRGRSPPNWHSHRIAAQRQTSYFHVRAIAPFPVLAERTNVMREDSPPLAQLSSRGIHTLRIELPELSTRLMRRARLDCLMAAIWRCIKVAGANTWIIGLSQGGRNDYGGKNHSNQKVPHRSSPSPAELQPISRWLKQKYSARAQRFYSQS